MKTENTPIGELTPDPKNPRRHPEGNLDAIEASLRRFGQVLPLVVREGVVVGGNGTLEAMKRLGYKEAAIVNFRGTKQEAQALAIALNRSAELATWDLDVLGSDFVELSEAGIMPDDLGFDMADLENMFPPEPVKEPEPFEVAQPKVEKEKPKAPPAQYALLFDDTDQEIRFYKFLRYLKEAHPEGDSVAERLDLHIKAST